MTEDTIILRVRVPAPTPAQVHAWLLAHGWVEVLSVTTGMGAGLRVADAGWRDYDRTSKGGLDGVGIPQRYGKGGFSGAMASVLEQIAQHHGIEPIELHRQITTPAGLVELAAREANHD